MWHATHTDGARMLSFPYLRRSVTRNSHPEGEFCVVSLRFDLVGLLNIRQTSKEARR